MGKVSVSAELLRKVLETAFEDSKTVEGDRCLGDHELYESDRARIKQLAAEAGIEAKFYDE